MTVMNLSANKLMAQEKKEYRMSWKAEAILPDANQTEKQPGVAGPVTGVNNETLIVAGGANFPNGMPWNGAKKVYQDEIYLFHKKNGKILAAVSSQKLPQPIAYSANVTTPAGVIYLGGENETGVSDQVIMLNYDKKSDRVSFTKLKSLPFPLTNLAATVLENTIYVAGGENLNGVSNKFLSFNLSLPDAKWEMLPDIPESVSHTVLAAQFNGTNSAIYLIGGRAKREGGISQIFSSTYEFDTSVRQWSLKKQLPYPISAATGIAYLSDHIIVCSGDKGEVFSKVEMMNMMINKEPDQSEKQKLTTEKVFLLTTHPGFSKDILMYNTIADKWLKIGEIPFAAPVTTSLVNWESELILPSGEIKAGVRSPKILTGKISRIKK